MESNAEATLTTPVDPLHKAEVYLAKHGIESLFEEVHILHEFPEDFYGEELKVVVVQYLRPERDFASLDALIAAIHEDISRTKVALDEPDLLRFLGDPIFRR